MWLQILSIIVFIVLWSLRWIHKRYNYFKYRGIPYITPEFPYGNTKTMSRTEDIGTLTTRLYNELKGKGKPVAGFFSFVFPAILVTDLDLLKTILVKDFPAFMSRGVYYNEKDDPISAHLFAMDGDPWKIMRKKLSPTFSSGKMKFMFPTMVAVADEFTKCIKNELKISQEIEMKDILSRFTTDIIGSCAFGLECNSLTDQNAIFHEMGRKVFATNTMNRFKRGIITAYPKLGQKLGITTTLPEVSEFCMKSVRDTVEYRQKNNIVKNDFLNLLLDIGKQNETEGLTLNEITAQSFVFFLAGFETSSTAMSFAMYELALNQELQNKAREEVRTCLEIFDGNMSYDAVMEMKYIFQVIDESLRKYPPGSVLLRRTTRDYNIEGTDIVLEKGIRVMVPVMGIQRDPEYYPEPEKFDPDRFAEPALSKRNPYAFMAFGEGPRNCIGLRFGMMQAVLGLASLLHNFKFMIGEKTAQPLTIDPKRFVLSSKGGLWLKVENI